MTVRFASGFEAPELPAGWAQDNGSLTCLRCRRELVANVAGDPHDPEARRSRRRALVAFELRRGLQPKDAARAAATSTRVASQVHRELVAVGELDRRASPKRKAVAAALVEDPERSNGWMAGIVGCSAPYVLEVRRSLERAGVIPRVARVRTPAGRTWPAHRAPSGFRGKVEP